MEKNLHSLHNKDKDKFKGIIRNVLYSTVVFALIVYIIVYPKNSVDFVIKGLNLCYIIIIPSIFPFLIFSKMFFSTPLVGFIGKVLNKPAKLLFDISGDYTNAFLIGSIAGFPIGAKSVADIYSANPSTKSEAERTLAFCNNCSAPFIIAAVGIGIFGSSEIGFLLFFTQLASALITGIIIRFLFMDKKNKSNRSNESAIHMKHMKEQIRHKSSDMPDRLDIPDKPDITSVISDAVTGMLNICGIIIFFSIVINITLEILNLLPVVSNNASVYTAIKIISSGILEISSGVYSLTGVNLSFSQKLICSSVILAWSGLSVHFQIKYVLKNTGLSLKPYFTGKIIHVIISTVLIKILADVKSIAAMCYVAYMPPSAVFDNYQSYIASLIATLIITLIIFAAIAVTALAYLLYEKLRQSKTERY